MVRTTLELADDVMVAARELAAAQRTSIGAVVSERARRGLAPARVDARGDMPVMRVPKGSPPITAEMLTLARRHRTRLVTFDSDLNRLAGGRDVELLVS